MAHPVRRGPWPVGGSPMTSSPYLTGDMPSSGTAVNAIVGGVRREAVVVGSVLSRTLTAPPRPG